MSKPQLVKSKRQVVREQRERRQKQQRITMLIVVFIGALLISAILIVPPIVDAAKPVGTIVDITPKEYPDGEGTSLGDPNAPVLVEVWEDFQCSACKSYSEGIEPQVIENYVATGKAHYVFRQFPFLDDKAATRESDKSANASLCAAEQGRFWDYKAILFANFAGGNSGNYRDKRLVAFAERLGLDMAAFTACFDANKFKDQIEKDLADGKAAGVSGTPSVFVNGQILKPGFIPSYDDVAAAIESALSSK